MAKSFFKIGIPISSYSILIILISNFRAESFGENNPEGFLNINCGSNFSLQDMNTNLWWDGDEKYILSGERGSVPDPTSYSNLQNYQALTSFRYFPNTAKQSKYCYEIYMPLNNVSFILRAMFLHGNATELELPIIFSVYVNATQWVRWSSYVDDVTEPLVKESVFFMPLEGNRTDICLVPEYDTTPFISSIEIRFLDPESIMYSEAFEHHLQEQLYFSKLRRLNFGAETHTPPLRYPIDRYDRLWYPTPPGIAHDTTGYASSLPANLTTTPQINNVPLKVMNDAVYEDGGYSYSLFLPFTEAGSLVHVICYFALLNTSQRSISLSLDEQDYPTFRITDQPIMKSFYHVLNLNYINVKFKGSHVLNALEIFKQDSFIKPVTNHDDVNVISFLKKTFNLTQWQGDPCKPYEYDWVDCKINPSYDGLSYDIISISLAHLEKSQMLRNLGTNTPRMSQLSSVLITDSNIDSYTFSSLVKNFLVTNSIRYLDFNSNNITSFPNLSVWMNAYNTLQRDEDSNGFCFNFLNFSRNQLSSVPPFSKAPFARCVRTLDISNNQITGDFPGVSSFTNLTSLTALNVSYNLLGGNVPQSLSFSNLPSLINLNISHNNFGGDLNFSFYFNQHLVEPFILDASYNAFSGVLDLTEWYHRLEKVLPNSTELDTDDYDIFYPLFSFANNNITQILPAAEHFETIIESLMSKSGFNRSGVLLGGNPYCTKAKHFTQRYLCRTYATDEVHADREENKKTLAIVLVVVCGSFILLGFLASSLIISRLWKQVHNLKQIQQELAGRRVQPPYMTYKELKSGTHNFHHSNKLGRGSFGAVYKGKLLDGTTVAVKRLFHAKQKQVLEDFLNEVVLITGIKHRNLVQLKACCIENQERILVYEYAENGNLADAIWGEDAPYIRALLDWKSRFNICIGIARGLSYLHEELLPRIVHRDIKPANVLLDANLNAKIADFGTARLFSDEQEDDHFTKVVSGTKGYFAPEYVSEGRLTVKADVYSFGVLVLEIVSGRRWHDVPPEQIHIRVWAKELHSAGASLDVLDLTLRSECDEQEVIRTINIALMCVRMDPELRPTMSEVVTMMLEGKERTYKEMSKELQRDKSMGGLTSIYEHLEIDFGHDAASTSTSMSMSMDGDRFKFPDSTSFSVVSQDSEKSPLMWGALSPMTKRAYLQTFKAMTRSLSERIRR